MFTPKVQIMALPRGATAVDLAYSVHTDIGNRCIAVKINDELAPLRTELRNGDRVEVITAPHAHPNPAWLNYVVTGKARAHIRHYLKTMHSQEAAMLGERLLNQALRALRAEPGMIDDARWSELLRETNTKSKEEILADIGLGKRLNLVIARRLISSGEALSAEKKPLGSITIRGTEGLAVQFAKCCRPIPGDPILGVINKGKGLIIHTHDCPAIAQFRADPDKWVDVEWDPETKKLFDVNIKLVVANQRGVLAKVAAAIANENANIENVNMEEEDGSAYTAMNFTLQVENRDHLARLMRGVRQIPEVARITRVKG